MLSFSHKIHLNLSLHHWQSGILLFLLSSRRRGQEQEDGGVCQVLGLGQARWTANTLYFTKKIKLFLNLNLVTYLRKCGVQYLCLNWQVPALRAPPSNNILWRFQEKEHCCCCYRRYKRRKKKIRTFIRRPTGPKNINSIYVCGQKKWRKNTALTWELKNKDTFWVTNHPSRQAF